MCIINVPTNVTPYLFYPDGKRDKWRHSRRYSVIYKLWWRVSQPQPTYCPLKDCLPGSLSLSTSLPPSAYVTQLSSCLLPLSPHLAPSLSLGPFSFHPHAKSNHYLRGNGQSCDLHLFLWLVATRWSHLATRAHTHTHAPPLSSSQTCVSFSAPLSTQSISSELLSWLTSLLHILSNH